MNIDITTITAIAEAALAHRQTVERRILGLPVRSRVGQRIDAELQNAASHRASARVGGDMGDELIAALCAFLRLIMYEEISRILGAGTVQSVAQPVQSVVFSSDGLLPPRKRRRWFRETAPKIPGAWREGGKRGRSVVWYVKSSDYFAWLESRRSVTTTTTKPVAGVPSDAERDGWIAEAGYRFTRPQ